MRKKLLSALLALAMVLSLLPTTAFAAAEVSGDIIESVGFAYRRPTITPKDGDNETTRWQEFYKLRNVFVVRFKTPVTDTGYSFEVKAGSGGTYQQVTTVYYTGTQPTINGSTAAYFEAPDGVMNAAQTTYTVRVTKDGESEEKSVTLLKVTLKKSDNNNLAAENFTDEDASHVQMADGVYSVFAEPGDTYVYLPNLKDGTAGGGSSEDQQFVGWANDGSSSADAFSQNPITANKTVHAIFGVKPVSGFVLTDRFPAESFPTSNKTEFKTEVGYGATASSPISIYIVNIGNQNLGNEASNKGFYVSTKDTGNFTLEFQDNNDDGGSKGVKKFGTGTDKYVINAGYNTGKAPTVTDASYLVLKCTPKTGLQAGTYTDKLVINTPDRLITQVTLTVEVKPIDVTVEMPEITKEYGQHIVLDADGKWGEKGGPTVKVNDVTAEALTFSDLGVTITSDGFHAGADANNSGYDYRIEGQPSNRNYNVKLAGESGKVIVSKAIPEGGISVTASAIKTGQKLTDSVLQGAFVNPNHKDWKVEGQFEWTDRDKDTPISTAYPDGTVKNWKFTPTNNNYEAVEGTATVIVSGRTPTTIHLNTNTNRDTVTFDGMQHRLDFTLSYTDNEKGQQHLDGKITTKYKEHTGAADKEHGEGGYSKGWPVEAGVYDVKAEYAGTDEYAPAEAVFHLTIEPKTVIISPTVQTKEYDGETKATVSCAVSDTVGSYPVSVSCTANFSDANAGDNKEVTIKNIILNSKNYKPKSETLYTYGTISRAHITLAVENSDALSKNYGEQYEFVRTNFKATGLKNNENISSLNLEFASEGAGAEAEVGSYDITAQLNGGNYTLSGSGTVGRLEVKPVTLSDNNKTTALQKEPTATPGYRGGNKSDVKINDGVVVNPYNPDMVVEGTWELTNATGSFSSDDETATLNWKFTPTDKNYTGTLTGTITVNVLEKKPVELTLREGTALTVTYDGNVHALTADDFEADIPAEIAVSYTDNKVPQDAGIYTIIVTATPTGEYANKRDTAKTEVTLNITKATVPNPNWSFSGLEGTQLSDLEKLPAAITGVDGTPINGTFQWEVPGATIADENGSTHNWIFTHEDPNHLSPVTGSAFVTMEADPRTVSATVYNLPESDYAVVNTATSGLTPGEKVIFYKDAACKDPVSSETEVPADNNDKFIVNLDNDALAKEAGSIYAKIVGKKTAKNEITYPAELGFTLPNDMVLLHVGGANADKSETVSVVFSNDSYRSLVTADTWTVAGDGANFVEVTDNNNGSATFTAKAAGTTTITVAITFEHPDTVNHQGETITVTKEFSLNITSHYVVFTDETVTGGTATANPTEADEGDAVTVTLAPASGYRASGLEAYCRSADGTPDMTHKVAVSGSGSTYTFKMPASDVVLVPAFTQIPSGGGGSIGGGGAGGGGAAGPSTTPEPDTTVITPEAAADASGEARAPVDAAEVESAKQSGADEIVIEPQVTGNADKVSVELEKKSVDTMADGTDADLTVKTDAANVTLPNDSLEDLAAKTGSKVTVSVEEKTGGEVGIEVAIDGKPMDSLSGGLKVDLPKTSGGNVLVIVGEDGSEKVVKKSVVENGHAYALLDGSCSVKVVNNSKTFADVAATDWYSDAVEFAGSHELFNGVGKNNFAPNEPMTRGMFATVLWRFESGEHVDASGTFADVAEGDWYTDGVTWASRHGIITGYSSDTFAPADNVTREQLATMLYRYAKDIGLDVSETGSLNRFSDSDDVSAYAKDAVAWAVGVGLIKGNTDNTINPAGGAKRAEVATIFMRFCELITK